MKNENKVKLITVAAAGALFAVMGLDNTLTVADYTIRNEKIQKPVSIAFLSDIHSQKFKKNGEDFLSTVSSLNADVILFGGDIFDKHSSEKELARTFELVKKIKEINENCFFVLGNHDLDCKRDTELKKKVAEMGINVFENGSCVVESKSGQQILIGGTDYVHCDNDIPEDGKALEAKKELIKQSFEPIAQAMLAKNLSIYMVAKLAGVNSATVYAWQNGDYKPKADKPGEQTPLEAAKEDVRQGANDLEAMDELPTTVWLPDAAQVRLPTSAARTPASPLCVVKPTCGFTSGSPS